MTRKNAAEKKRTATDAALGLDLQETKKREAVDAGDMLLEGISVSEAFLDSAPPLATPQKTEKKRSAQEDAALDGGDTIVQKKTCLLYTSPSPRDTERSRMPSSA